MNIVMNEKKNNIEVGDVIKLDGELYLIAYNTEKFCDFPYVLVNLNTFEINDTYSDLMTLQDECDLVCKNKNITLTLNQ